MSDETNNTEESLIAKSRALNTCIAQSVELFLHYDRGGDSLFTGGAGGIGFIAIFEFWMVSFLPHDNPYPLAMFGAACALLCIVHRINVRRGRLSHSRYTGKPLLGKLLPLDEGIIKIVEPFLVMGFGVLTYRHFNRPLGLYLTLAGAMLLIYIVRAIREERAGHRQDKPE